MYIAIITGKLKLGCASAMHGTGRSLGIVYWAVECQVVT